MSRDIDIDLAPPPEDTLTFVRLRGGGWLLIHDGQSEVAFSSAADMIRWLEDTIAPTERPELPPVTLPSLLEASRPEPARIWKIFAGGKR